MIHDTNGAEHQLEPVDPDEDYSWMDRYSRPDDNALSIRGVVAGTCIGIVFAIFLVAVVS